jgi:4-amino-4-deoxy-L-arabinose transferase-like glycosyltransferase
MWTKLMSQEEPQTVLKSINVTNPQIVLLLVLLALFMPFVNKPFNIDDPLFIWAAKHIQHNPLDFYGFDVNWYQSVEPMALVTKNPPLFSYYLAGIGICFGWSEVAMHLAMMVPLIALALGTFRLAGQLDAKPLQAALISLCTPVVMVSGTSVMCDLPMVALWVWAVSFWINGNEAPYHKGLLLAAGCLITAAGLTKYFGASLIPLLASYSIMRRTPLRRWLPYLLIPAAIFFLYEVATYRMYGVGLLSDAFAYSAETRIKLHRNFIQGTIDSLSFTGGGLIVVIFITPFLFRLKGWLSCAIGIVGISITSYFLNIDNKANLGISIQQAAFIISACVLLTITVSDLVKNRDAKSLLLALWILGTFVFVCMVNWTVSERNILPMAPAVGLIISRRLAQRPTHYSRLDWSGFAFALMSALSLSLLVTLADYRWSSEMAKTVQQIYSYRSSTGQRLWFQGHWGFQYYMEQIGGTHLDFTASKVQAGDLFVTPSFGSNLESLSEDILEIASELPTTPLSRLSVMNPPIGAGFYSNEFGPLPYVFARVQPEKYIIGVFKQNIRFAQ